MAVYRKPDGTELLVCDGCGIAHDGTRADLSAMTKVDFSAEMIAAGFPEGTALDAKDYCPACNGTETSNG